MPKKIDLSKCKVGQRLRRGDKVILTVVAVDREDPDIPVWAGRENEMYWYTAKGERLSHPRPGTEIIEILKDEKPKKKEPKKEKPKSTQEPFLFYPEHWLVGVAGMTDLEQITFLRLLCHQWINNGLPKSASALGCLAGNRGMTQAVLAKVPIDPKDGKRRNAMLEEQRKPRWGRTPQKPRWGELPG